MSVPRIDHVVSCVAKFACDLLELRCPVDPDSHAVVYDVDDPHRLRSVGELIVFDGHVSAAGSGEGSARHRRLLAHAHALLDFNVAAMREHCADYLEFLYILEGTIVRRYAADDVVDLHAVVTTDPRWSLGYFCRLCLDARGRLVDTSDASDANLQSNTYNLVGVGGLAGAIATTIEGDVKKWVMECELAVERDLALGENDESDTANTLVDTMRTSKLRAELTSVITKHLAMVGMLRGDDDDPARLQTRESVLNDAALRRLLASQLDDDAVARCERCRSDQIDKLQLLARL